MDPQQHWQALIRCGRRSEDIEDQTVFARRYRSRRRVVAAAIERG
jgi:hypothetical protein